MKYKNVNKQELLQELDKIDNKWNKVKRFLLGSIAVFLIIFSGLMTTYLIVNYEKIIQLVLI